MPFNISYQPSQALVGQAGYTAGLGDYNRYLNNLQLQQQQLIQNERMQQRQIGAQQYGQQYDVANQQYMQGQNIANQQVMQARGFDVQEYMQQQDLLNSRVMQSNQLSYNQFAQLSNQAFQAGQQANQIGANQWAQVYGTAAQQQSQQYAGQMQSALSAQGFMQSLGLGDQHFASSAALQNLQTQNNIDMNRANLQTQLDFLPQLSEAEYQARQQQFANNFQQLGTALQNGEIDQPAYQQAQSQLLAQQLGLRSMMPKQSDMAGRFASMAYTDTSTTIPGLNQPLRYLFNPQTGGFEPDPGQQMQISAQRYQDAVSQRVVANGYQQINATLDQIATLAAKYMQVSPDMDPDAAYAKAETQIMSSLQRRMRGAAPAPAM